MTLTVLSIGYSLHPVCDAAVGGSEQVLSMLDAALVAHGARSIVVACEGSTISGTLVSTPRPPEELTEQTLLSSWDQQLIAIEHALERYPVDVIHMHGVDFHGYLPPPGVPTLVTLHLPISWYPMHALFPKRPRTHLHCVSRSQHCSGPSGMQLLPPIENGVPVESYDFRARRRDLVVALGRICPEKGFHVALDAAHRARIAMILAGRVFGYDLHRQYFEREIRPRLDAQRRFVGPVGFRQKRRLLASARCVLIPSIAPETSSLVAMEALASGTPVIAHPTGALVDIVEHGRTGFLVDDERQMADAIAAAGDLDRETCRAVARERFSLDRMIHRYLSQYAALRDARTRAA